MDEGRPRFEADASERDELAARFFDAIRDGDIGALQDLLAADVTMVGDSGGKAPLWGKGVFGGANVARLLASLMPWFFQIGGSFDRRVVNGQPGAIFRDRDGLVLNTWALDVLDGQIQAIRTVLNPDKLAHLGPVADAHQVVRDAYDARRAGER
jgi:RNA polymerase sigma-70 factor (ECF subfamily)